MNGFVGGKSNILIRFIPAQGTLPLGQSATSFRALWIPLSHDLKNPFLRSGRKPTRYSPRQKPLVVVRMSLAAEIARRGLHDAGC